MGKVYFATNRAADPAGGFGSSLAEVVSYGTATIGPHGKPIVDQPVTAGAWSDDVLDEIISAGKPILVTIHGFDYSAADAIRRAAQLGDLYGQAGGDAVVLTFTWPSRGELVDGLDLEDAYFSDQKMAAVSAGALATFFERVALIRANQLAAGKPVQITLLCHSMGNYAGAGAIGLLKPGIIFDAAILAAADEPWISFSDPARLGNLCAVSTRQTVYFSRRDEALMLSQSPIVNDVQRIGYDGPKGRADAALFPPEIFRLVDVTAIDPEDVNPDDSHQYYRTVPAVVADIASVIAGTAQPVGTLVEKAA